MSQTQVVHLKANVFEIPTESKYATELQRSNCESVGCVGRTYTAGACRSELMLIVTSTLVAAWLVDARAVHAHLVARTLVYICTNTHKHGAAA